MITACSLCGCCVDACYGINHVVSIVIMVTLKHCLITNWLCDRRKRGSNAPLINVQIHLLINCNMFRYVLHDDVDDNPSPDILG